MTGNTPGSIEILRPVAEDASIGPLTEAPTSEPQSWWDRYWATVATLPEDTRSAVELDARYIAMHAMPRSDDALDFDAFGSNRVRTGIVVGSVQSGKTASMLAVTALLLDGGVDIVIVLAGTRVALWLQTYDRLLGQLDGTDLHSAWTRNSARVLVPQPEDIISGSERVDPHRYLRGARLRVKSAFRAKKPVIFVIPKEDDHLLALSRFLAEQIESRVRDGSDSPLTMVVLDDEADDASILDASDASRITPQFIQYLWASDASAPATRHPNVYATYVAYTATPQANYLQRSHNPLAPRSFHAALRVPSDKGTMTPRSVTYCERKGLASYYTGGEFYYESLRDLPGDPCVSYAFPSAQPGEDSASVAVRHASVRWQMIGDAMRSYLVAGALRLLFQKRQLSTVPTDPVVLSRLLNELPATHSMLYHPSALKEEHFEGADDLVRWSLAIPGSEEQTELPTERFGNPVFILDSDGLERRLAIEEEQWKEWLFAFTATASGLASLPGGTPLPLHSVTWEQVKELLVGEVFPNVKLRVLNSDPRADERPSFRPTPIDSKKELWLAPRDIYTVFVAGNVLSRGLTVEGLCTSLFLRSAREPAADTQMQMQRWFGYRGSHLALCRVFLFADQLQLFRQYHSNDLALKTEVLSRMDSGKPPFSDGVLVLQGSNFTATAKVDSRRVPLHPGATPAVRLIEPSSGTYYEHNLQLVQELMHAGEWKHLIYPEGTERGLIRTTPLSMLDVADILDGLRYTAHDPDVALEISQRWESLQHLIGATEPLFRPPRVNSGPMAVDPNGCPYSIAAYLRFWNAALERTNLPGMQPTDNPTMPWSMLNLALYRATKPQFYLGIRFGAEGETKQLRFRGMPLKMMRRGFSNARSDLLETLWGSRNPSERWKGDQAFDYHFHDPLHSPRILEDGAWRPRGQPGLLLLHPVVELSTGRETIAVGLALPHGGPDHVAALRIGGMN